MVRAKIMTKALAGATVLIMLFAGCAKAELSSASESTSAATFAVTTEATEAQATEPMSEQGTSALTTKTPQEAPVPEATTEHDTSAATTTEEPETQVQSTTITQSSDKDTSAPPETKLPETEALPIVTEDKNTEKQIIALTFDDGPNTTTTAQVLDVLEKYDIVASFFLVGNNINDDSAENVKRAFEMGCEINNHSKTHAYMNEMTSEEIKAEIDYTSDKIYEITGVYPKFFRPPYIAVSDTMFDTIDLPFVAGVGANDWDARVTAENRAKRIIKQAKDGTVILLHDAEGNTPTVEALDTIIPTLLGQGYQFVTMSQLFELKGLTPNEKIIYTYVDQTTMYG